MSLLRLRRTGWPEWRIVSELHCTEDQRLEALEFLVEGSARKWWRSIFSAIKIDQGAVTWADFQFAFKEKYFSATVRQSRIIELSQLRQRIMSIEEYQQKFYSLLPYSPHIDASEEGKYYQYLQGLNQEIFDLVTVNSQPTSYEDLMNMCRQAEHSIARGRTAEFSRSASSLGPRAQSFNKSGSSSSGSGGVLQFGRKKEKCDQCGGRHSSEHCRRVSEACCLCGEMGHMKKKCPQERSGACS